MHVATLSMFISKILVHHHEQHWCLGMHQQVENKPDRGPLHSKCKANPTAQGTSLVYLARDLTNPRRVACRGSKAFMSSAQLCLRFNVSAKQQMPFRH